MRKVFLGALLILAVIVIALKLTTPFYVKHKIISSLKANCPACEIEIENASLSIGELTLTNVLFKGDPKDNTTLNFKIGSLDLEFYPKTLFSDFPELKNLILKNLEVEVTDDAGKHPIPGPIPKHWVLGLPGFSIESVKIKDSIFKYFLKINGTRAQIVVSKINGSVSQFATRPNLGVKMTNAELDALLEKSGIVKIKISADLFGDPNKDKVSLDIKNLQLPQMQPFFGVEDKVTLAGTLHHIFTNFELSNGHMIGQLGADYSDFEMKYEKAKDRTDVQNFLVNLLSSVALVKTRPRENEPVPVIEIKQDRKLNQPIIQFILDGLKDAASKIMAGKNQPTNKSPESLIHKPNAI